MPEFRGLTVEVRKQSVNDSAALKEWGIHQLSRSKTSSCYIQSETGMAFQISIRPAIPFPFEVDPQLPEDKQWKPATWARSNDELDDEFEDEEMDGEFSEALIREIDNHRCPPFDLLASVYIDGRKTPERRCVVYLDPDHPEHMIQDGEFSLRSTWLRGRDGKTYSHRWFFTDVGIETLFDKMALTNDMPANPSIVVQDELLSAMNKTQLTNSKAEPKLGQIKVVIERVTLSETFADPAYKAKRADQEDVNMDGARDISHAVKLEHGEAIPSKPVRVVHYDYYQEDEEPYAVFKFFYRSEDVLRKFNFEGFPKPAMTSSRTARSRRRMNDQLNFLTPLSITHPLPPRPADSVVKDRKKTLQSTDDEKHIKTFGSPTKRQCQAGSDDADDGGADNNKGADKNHRKAEFDAADHTFTPKQSDFRLQLEDDESDPSEGEDNTSGSSASTILLSPSSISALKRPVNAHPAPLIRSCALEREKKTNHREDPASNTFRYLVPPESACFAPNFDFHSPISVPSTLLSSVSRIPSPLSSNSGSTEHGQSSAKSSFKDFRLLEEQSGEDADAEDNDDTDTASIRATRADSAELEADGLMAPDQDDGGLHTELAKRLLLGKRSRDDDITAAGEDAAAEHTGDSAGWTVNTDVQGFGHRRRGVSGRGAVKSGASTRSGSRSSGEDGSDKAVKRTKREEGEPMVEQYCS